MFQGAGATAEARGRVGATVGVEVMVEAEAEGGSGVEVVWCKGVPLTPSSVVGHHSPSASNNLRDALSSPLQAKSMCHQQVLEFTDSEQDLPQVVNPSATLVLDNVDAAMAFVSDDEDSPTTADGEMCLFATSHPVNTDLAAAACESSSSADATPIPPDRGSMSDLLTIHAASAMRSTFLRADKDSVNDIGINATTQEPLNPPASIISNMASLFLAGNDSESTDKEDALPDDTNIISSIELNQPHRPVNLPASLAAMASSFLDGSNSENDDDNAHHLVAETNIISSNEPNNRRMFRHLFATWHLCFWTAIIQTMVKIHVHFLPRLFLSTRNFRLEVLCTLTLPAIKQHHTGYTLVSLRLICVLCWIWMMITMMQRSLILWVQILLMVRIRANHLITFWMIGLAICESPHQFFILFSPGLCFVL